jgi:hypothetical protein
LLIERMPDVVGAKPVDPNTLVDVKPVATQPKTTAGEATCLTTTTVKQNTEVKEEIAGLTVRVIGMAITRIITRENGETSLFYALTVILIITASKDTIMVTSTPQIIPGGKTGTPLLVAMEGKQNARRMDTMQVVMGKKQEATVQKLAIIYSPRALSGAGTSMRDKGRGVVATMVIMTKTRTDATTRKLEDMVVVVAALAPQLGVEKPTSVWMSVETARGAPQMRTAANPRAIHQMFKAAMEVWDPIRTRGLRRVLAMEPMSSEAVRNGSLAKRCISQQQRRGPRRTHTPQSLSS